MIKTIRIIACTAMLCLSAATAKADALLDLVRQLTYRGVRMRGKDDMLDAYRAAYHPKEKK